MITLEQFRDLDFQVSRARGVRSTTPDPKPAGLRRFSAAAVKQDILDLTAQGDRVMAARTALNEQFGWGLEVW